MKHFSKVIASGFIIAIVFCCQFDIKNQEMNNHENISIEEISEKVKELEHKLFNAIQKKDTLQLSKILTKNFTYKNSESGEISRDEFLSNIRSLPFKIESVYSNNLAVKVVTENLAIITGIQKSTIKVDEKIKTFSVAFTDIFIRIDGKWYLDFANGIDLTETN